MRDEQRLPRKSSRIGPSASKTSETLHRQLSSVGPSGARDQFVEAMRKRGLVPPGEGISADGQMHRCDVDGKTGKRDGSYIFYPDGPIPAGWFKNWCDGQSGQTWRYAGKGQKLGTAQQRELDRVIASINQQRTAETAKRQAEAREKAKRLWNDAEDATDDHAYCRRKKVKPYGLRMMRFKDGSRSLLVPASDENGDLQTLQFIPEAVGSKKVFLSGGRAAGSHFWVKRPKGHQTICIATGWATGETIFQATGYAVVICFGDNNLKAVAEWIRERYPDHNIIICGDDDWKKEKNSGRVSAIEAARSIGVRVAFPIFGEDRLDDWTDFNDLAAALGLRAVKDDVDSAAALSDEAKDNGAIGGTQSDLLIQLASMAVLFHSGEDGYADLIIEGHRETWPVKSTAFRRWLTREYYAKTKGAPNRTAMTSALEVIDAQAKYDGPAREVFLRVAGRDGRIYIDLCDNEWRAVEVASDGWRLVSDPPVRFHRRRGMQMLPVPKHGGKIETLREYLNIGTQAGFILTVAWLVAALRNRGPYPVFKVTGEAGSAKSTTLAVLKCLIDPNVDYRKQPAAHSLRAPPRDERDVFIAANSSHVLAYDNLSSLQDWLSDALARLSTGGAFATRQLYTDDEEKVFNAARPILLGAIDNVVVRGDLADRSLAENLERLSEKKRCLEREFWSEFESDHPFILGALLDAVANGLRQLPYVHLDRLPRMADFMEWAIACGDGLLWDRGAFAQAYEANIHAVAADVIDANLVATKVQAFILEEHEWSGEMGQLLTKLDRLVSEEQRKSKSWPKATNVLSNKLTRAASDLRKLGIEIEQSRDQRSRRKIVKIAWSAKHPSLSFGPSDSFGINRLSAKDHVEHAPGRSFAGKSLQGHTFEGSMDPKDDLQGLRTRQTNYAWEWFKRPSVSPRRSRRSKV